MARKPRVRLENLTYHVFSRCIEKKNLMLSNFIKDIMISVIKKSMEKYDFKLVAYEILEDHFHFIIQTVSEEDDISRIMQYIKARFAEQYNKKMERVGPFWNERFKCTIIEYALDPLSYFLWLLWYVAYNAVRKRTVKDPRESQYGSINVYLHEEFECPLDVHRHDLFMSCGETHEERVALLLDFEKRYVEKTFTM